MSFIEEPKYDLLKKMFREELIKMNEEERPLDWMHETYKKWF